MFGQLCTHQLLLHRPCALLLLMTMWLLLLMTMWCPSGQQYMQPAISYFNFRSTQAARGPYANDCLGCCNAAGGTSLTH